MKTKLLFLAFLLLCCALNSQSTAPAGPATGNKGAGPLSIPDAARRTPNSTRAVIVGISDYQDKNIPDLQYAHRDAEAFAAWLKSPAGGQVPDDHISLLTNEQASIGRLALALTWLMEESKPGDHALIFFSGHGDVETKTAFQLGFLLCWDSPAQNYMAGGFSLYNLQAVISTLSANQVQVAVITDACHAGKLAGNAVSGAQITGANLAKQFANECKILSCQPNEFSLEGTQWGGGRGAFSYHLLEGLTGLADRNGDDAVSLYEIDRYLGDLVPAETAPHPQMPVTVGDRQALLAQIDGPALAALKARKAGQMPQLVATGAKGFEAALLSGADSVSKALFRAFEQALERGALLEPDTAGASAYALYRQSLNLEELRSLRNLMRRNLAAALIDEGQQALNALLESDPYEINNWQFNPQKYTHYPAYLDKALELLGNGHYMATTLQVKKMYFEAYLLARSLTDAEREKTARDSIKELAKAKLLGALTLEPSAAYVYHAISNLYNWSSPVQVDSLVRYAQLALTYAPNWLLPYIDVAAEYSYSLNDLAQSERWLMEAMKIDSSSYLVLERLSWLRQWQNRSDETLDLCRRMKALHPDLFNAYATAGATHLMRKEFASAEADFNRALTLSGSIINNWAYPFMIDLYLKTRRIGQGLALAKAYIQNDSTEVLHKSHMMIQLALHFRATHQYDALEHWSQELGRLNAVGQHLSISHMFQSMVKICRDRNYPEARVLLQKSIGSDPGNRILQFFFDAYAAEMAWQQDRFAEADSLFQQALQMTGLTALDDRKDLLREETRFRYGRFLLEQKRFAEAQAQFQVLCYTEPLGYFGYYGLAVFFAEKGQKTAALDYLEQALDRWYPIPEPIYQEPLFKKIRQTKRFRTLMAKYFPASR